MKIWWAVLCVGAGLSVAARGDDLTTLTGQTYSNIFVQQYDRQGITVLHDGGSTPIPFRDISPELRGHYKALSRIPISLTKMSGEKQEPLGPNDLSTLSGQIYRNVVLKQVGEDRILIAHDTGMDTVYFAAMSAPMQEKYRSGTSAVPDPAPDADDIVTTYGQIFRNTQITREEPDGLTFRHDGGVTKLGFPALGEEVQKKHGYDPIVAWKYQRDEAAKRAPIAATEAPAEEKPTGPVTFAVFAIETDKLPDNTYWLRFSVTNLTAKSLSVQAVPCTETKSAIMGGKTISIGASSVAGLQQLVVPEIAPSFLKVSSGAYFTNVALTWK